MVSLRAYLNQIILVEVLVEITLNNEAISRLTGAPLSALEKKGIKEYKSQAVRSGEDVFIEGAIVDSSSFLAGYEGFFSPQNLRERLDETSGDINLFIDSPGGSVFAASNMSVSYTHLTLPTKA